MPSVYEFGASCASAAFAGGVTVAIFNPLDTVKFCSAGLMAGLWAPGCLANGFGIGMSSMGRVGLYPFIRDLVAPPSSGGASPGTMFTSGLLAGAIGYWCSSPVYQVKTLKQAEAGVLDTNGKLLSGSKAGQLAVYHGRSLISCLGTLASQRALFRGSSALVVRGALLSAGNCVGYDGCKTYARKMNVQEDNNIHGDLSVGSTKKESPYVHILASIVGAFVGTVTATPADVLMTRYQSQPFPNLTACLRHIIQTEGPLGLYRGFLPFFVRLAPVFVVSLPATEQLRRLLGLGYI